MTAMTINRQTAIRKAERESSSRFCVFWMDGTRGQNPEDDIISALVFRGPDAGVRAFRFGHLDMRAGDENTMPRFSNPMWALAWMQANRGKKCLVNIDCARVLREDDEYKDA